MLLCLVNDVLDIKSIEQDKFQAKVEKFLPMKLFDFIIAMFKPQCEMQKTKIVMETISALTSEQAI